MTDHTDVRALWSWSMERCRIRDRDDVGVGYTVYATAIDPKRGSLGTIAPIAIGFIVGANILAGGAFDGASMNPEVSFGPALVCWSWENHWVYWVGPLIGGGLAGLVYELFFISHSHEQLPCPNH